MKCVFRPTCILHANYAPTQQVSKHILYYVDKNK